MPSFKSCRGSPPSLSPATIVATLDLAQPQERAAHELLRRFCTGRWPTWRLFGLRRSGRTLYAAVEWQRCKTRERFSVAELSLDGPAVRWRCFTSAVDVRRALAGLDARAAAASQSATP